MFILERQINDANYQNYLKDDIAEKNEHFFLNIKNFTEKIFFEK